MPVVQVVFCKWHMFLYVIASFPHTGLFSMPQTSFLHMAFLEAQFLKLTTVINSYRVSGNLCKITLISFLLKITNGQVCNWKSKGIHVHRTAYITRRLISSVRTHYCRCCRHYHKLAPEFGQNSQRGNLFCTFCSSRMVQASRRHVVWMITNNCWMPTLPKNKIIIRLDFSYPQFLRCIWQPLL